MNYLLMWISSFSGAMVAVVGYSHYLNVKKTRVMLQFYTELKQSIEDEITFAEIAEELSKDMNYDD